MLLSSFSIFAQPFWKTSVHNTNYWNVFNQDTLPNENWNQCIGENNDWTGMYGGIGYGDNDDFSNIDTTIAIYINLTFYIDDENDILSGLLHADYDDGLCISLDALPINSNGVYYDCDDNCIVEIDDCDVCGGSNECLNIPDVDSEEIAPFRVVVAPEVAPLIVTLLEVPYIWWSGCLTLNVVELFSKVNGLVCSFIVSTSSLTRLTTPGVAVSNLARYITNFKSSVNDGAHVLLLCPLNRTPICGCLDTCLLPPNSVSPIREIQTLCVGTFALTTKQYSVLFNK